MKIKTKYKIELASSTDETRQSIFQKVFLDYKNKCAVATNGRILAKVPYEPESNLDTGLIDANALMTARKKAKKSDETTLGINGKYEFVDGSTQPIEKFDLTFPPYEQIIPKDRPIHHTVTFNPELLLELAKALGHSRGNSVTLEFDSSPLSPTIVKCDQESIGVMMPMSSVR